VSNVVTIRKLKYDGTVRSEWDGELVEAVGGQWVVVMHDSAVHQKREGGAPAAPAGAPHQYFLHYENLEQPLTILFCFDELGRWGSETKCDAALPATLRHRQVEFIDLDLDVIVGDDLGYFVRDHDTFALHTRTMVYTREVVATAHEGVRLAIELVESRAFPFDGSAEAVLGRVLASQGPL
jgi:protein associated with RNAse G/E